MSRYYRQISTKLSPEQAINTINAFYAANSYYQYIYNNEVWYKRGNGVLTGPMIMRALVANNIVTIEAFTQFAVLPGVYSGEIHPDEVLGAIPNQMLKNDINKLIFQLNPEYTYVAAQQYQQAYQQQAYQQNYQAQQQAYYAQQQAYYAQQQAYQAQQQAYRAQAQYQYQQRPSQPVQPQLRHCPFCGYDISSDTVFCQRCGKKIKK